MYWLALFALLALLGLVAFAIALLWTWRAGDALVRQPWGLALVAVGTLGLLWRVLGFYVQGRGTLADGILFCRGSLPRDTDVVTIGTPDERIADWCAGVDVSTIVCGQTHGQFERMVGRWQVVNAASVGSPFGDLGAYWALFDGGTSLELTAYDVHTAARRIVATGYPLGPQLAKTITTRTTAADAARLFDEAMSDGAA